MRSLVFVTQEVDPAHPALAATVPKIAALARLVDRVAVLAGGAVPESLPPNCVMRTFASRTRVGRGVLFERALSAEMARARPIAVVAHMCPIYAVLAAPLARPLGVPVLMWYTHWHASRTLKLAARMSTAIVSVDRRSFPIASKKVHAIGHGIDISQFPCRADGTHDGGLRLLALGRYSPAKGLDVVLRAIRRLRDDGLDARLTAHGPALSSQERSHLDDLRRLVEELGIGDRVELGDAVGRTQIPGLLAANDALVNNMRAGAPDKVVYEAAASCTPVLASNPVFDTLLPDELRFERDDAASLAARLETFARTTGDERAVLGRSLRKRVEAEHSVDDWAKRVIAVAEE